MHSHDSRNETSLSAARDRLASRVAELPPLELPTDYPRTTCSVPACESYQFALDAAVLGTLDEICQAEGTTLKIGILSLLLVLLNRYSRQDDFGVGIGLHSSERNQQRDVNKFILPLLVTLDPQQGIKSLLQHIKREVQNLCKYQSILLETIQRRIQSEPDFRIGSLCKVMICIEGLKDDQEENTNQAFDSALWNINDFWHDLDIHVDDQSEGGIVVTINYSDKLFYPERIESFACHFIALVKSLGQFPSAPLGTLNIMSEAELKVIRSWQQGPITHISNLCIHQQFELQAEQIPDAIALIYEADQITYDELNRRANQLARYLISMGVGPEKIVAVCMDRSVDLIVAILAVLKAGAAYLPLDPVYKSERLREILRDCDPLMLLADAEGCRSIGSVDWLQKIVVIDHSKPNLWSDESTQNLSHLEVDIKPDNLAYIIYTSGSTGKPKGVLLEHSGLVNLAAEQQRIFGVKRGSRLLQFSSFSFDVATSEWATTLCHGATLILCNNSTRLSPTLLSDLLIDKRITHILLPAAVLGTLPIRDDYVLESLVVGGEACDPGLASEWSRRYNMINAYGPSEVTVCATTSEVKPEQSVTIGRPIANTSIYLLDSCGSPVPIGVAGELYIGGAGVARGYLNRFELTSERFLSDPFNDSPMARMYKTGDLCRWTRNGELEFIGRSDFQVKLRGYRIELGEIESNILTIPEISQAAVLLRKDEPSSPRLVAYWVPKCINSDQSAPAVTTEQIRSFLSDRLPDYMVPSAFVELESIPLTTNGKVDRKALPVPSFAGNLSLRIAPNSELTQKLHDIWAELLGHADFGITDNFFLIGGHSLAAARLLSRIEQRIGDPPPLVSFYNEPTIAALEFRLEHSSPRREKNAAESSIPKASCFVEETVLGCKVYEASFAQSRLWFLHKLEPDLTAYHMPTLWRIHGELDIHALELALASLIERHPTLRSSFQLEGTHVVQIIHPAREFPIAVELFDNQELSTAICDLLEHERSLPFDLSSGDLIRVRLLQVSLNEYLLLINHHHIASDGWSTAILAKDLCQFYNLYHGSPMAELAPLKVHYHDFAQWQRQRLSGPHLKRLLDYWTGQLKELDPLELPSDRQRPVIPSYAGDSISFSIDTSLLTPFEDLCHSEGATLQMGLLSLLAVLLHRYSRQDDFAIGVPIWGRNHPDLEALIGFFINTLPIRTRFYPEQTFRELLRQVRDTSIEAYDHQDLPFEQIVDALQLERDTSRNPLVQVMLQLSDLPDSSLDSLDGVVAESIIANDKSSTLDLTFEFCHSTNGLIARVTYSTDLFDADRIKRMLSHYQTLIESLVKAPESQITELDFIPMQEQGLIKDWQSGPNLQVIDLPIYSLIEHQVESTPDATALIFQNRSISYSELNQQSNRLARHLIELGVGDESIVAICLGRKVEMVVAILAILKAGGAYLPLDPSWPEARRRELVAASGAIAVVSDDMCLHFNSPLNTPCVSLNSLDTSTYLDINVEFCRSSLSSLAYLFYTSGSTGTPKGVAIEHHALTNRFFSLGSALSLSSDTKILALTTPVFDISILELIIPLGFGSTVILADDDERRDPIALQALIRANSVNFIQGTPSVLQNLTESGDLDITGLSVLVGGEALPSSLAHRLLCGALNLWNVYGPTEATIWSTIATINESRRITIGHPLANVDLYIVDQASKPCPIGVPGELLIGGAGLARGYHLNPVITGDKFIVNRSLTGSLDRVYRTGDLASWNPDGSVTFHGRIDHQVKLRGFRIELGDIEANLLRHPNVSKTTVLVRADDDAANHRLVAYWVPHVAPAKRGSSSESADQLRAFLADTLPEYMIPSAFVELEAIPLTTNGKVDRKALPAPSFSGNLDQRVSPSSELANCLHALWVDLLGHSDFGVTDNFFMIGGHSLAAARLIARIDKSFGRAPALASFFQHPTIEGLEHLLESTKDFNNISSDSSSILKAQPIADHSDSNHDVYEASFAQSGLWFLHKLQPELTAYHLPALWRILGDLDVAALEAAFYLLIDRHPTLRTSFRLHNDKVHQIIHQIFSFSIQFEELSSRTVSSVLDNWLLQESDTPFDLGAGMLIRARLLKVSSTEHFLLLNHHHIASDGWSLSVLTRDLAELYNSQHLNTHPDLPSLSVHYQDFSLWQRNRLHGHHLERLQGYWKSRLMQVESLELPSDRERPASPSYRGDFVSLKLDSRMIQSFNELCHSEGATLQMGLLSLVALILHRYSGQNDFAIGVPNWGRTHTDVEPLVGFFINTLPIPIHLHKGQSYRDLLRDVKLTSVEAYDHQELPFEQIVEALHIDRDISRNPLVQVMLQLSDLPDPSLASLADLKVEALHVKDPSCKVDLSFYFTRTLDNCLAVDIAYATDLFDRKRIESLASHLLTLANSIVESPDAEIATLNLLPANEKDLIVSWAQQQLIDVEDCCLHQLLESQVEHTPDSTAIIVENNSVSYKHLNDRANCIANHLIDLGVQPGDVVGIYIERSVDLAAAVFAILKAGATYLPLQLSDPVSRKISILHASAAKFVLVGENLEAFVEQDNINSVTAIHLSRLTHETSNYSNPSVERNPSSIAYIIFTSGTTGEPKGVCVSHRAVVNKCTVYKQIWDLTSDSKVLAKSSIAFDNAIREWILPLTSGSTVIVASESEHNNPHDICRLLTAHQCTHVAATPSSLELLTSIDLPPNLIITAGGEKFSPSLAQRLFSFNPKRLIHSYGSTESCLAFSLHDVCTSDLELASLPLGKPIPNSYAYILDLHGNLCPIGVPGELHIGGVGIADGYLNDAGLTAAKFLPDPFNSDSSSFLYKTGDIAFWNHDGTIHLLGRHDKQVKLRGFRIEPSGIETLLATHPLVDKAFVRVLDKHSPNAQLVAYWVPSDQSSVSLSSAEFYRNSTLTLRTFLVNHLPDYMIPTHFIPLEQIPVTSNGKLNERELPSYIQYSTSTHVTPPDSLLEHQIHSIWCQVLGHDNFGICDNFFDLGGHSLAAARISQLLYDEIGIEASLVNIFKLPTIRELAHYLKSTAHHAQPNNCLIPLQLQGKLPPLYVVHGYGGDLWHYVYIAKCLAPHRPVYGLQALGVSNPLERQGDIRQMAALYAESILKQHKTGPIHLLGFSCGGIYAHAVADALIQRGASIGMLSMFDTFGSYLMFKRMHRRIWQKLTVYLGQQSFKKMSSLLRTHQNRSIAHNVLHGFSSLVGRVGLIMPYFRLPKFYYRQVSTMSRWLDYRDKKFRAAQDKEQILLRNNVQHEQEFDYFVCLSNDYLPRRLPVQIHMFTQRQYAFMRSSIWNNGCIGGIRLHLNNLDHEAYAKLSAAEVLAYDLDVIMNTIENDCGLDSYSNTLAS